MGELSALRISVKIVEYALEGPTTRFGWRLLVFLLGADMLRAWMVELTRKIQMQMDRIPSGRYTRMLSTDAGIFSCVLRPNCWSLRRCITRVAPASLEVA